MELGPDSKNVNSERPVPREQDDDNADEKGKQTKKEEGNKDKKEKEEKSAEDVLATENPRLYVMNLSYQVSHDELRSLFSKYGEVVNIEVPLRKGGGGQALGISYITFAQTEGAISAFASLDKQYF